MRWHWRTLHGDDGATLIFALLVVTVVALITGALLTQGLANTMVTVNARQVAANQYAADAAAQYAANQVRLSNLTSGLCSSTSVTSEDLNFYPPGTTTGAQQAHVDCAPDSTNGSNPGGTGTSCPPVPAPCPNTAPGTALLTLDPNASETGIYVSVPSTKAINIRGGVFSNSAINVASGALSNTWCPANPPGSTTYVCSTSTPKTYVVARGTCTGSITFAQAGVTSQCNYPVPNDARGADPGVARPRYTPGASYGTPAAPTGQATSRSCLTLTVCTPDVVPASSCSSSMFQQVLPGRIAGAAGLAFLQALTGCSNGILQFTPGTYYFDLPSVWNPPGKLAIVAGSFAPGYDPVAGTGPGGWPASCSGGSCTADYQDSCIAPGDSGSTTSTGVQFVVGGGTQFLINNSSGFGSHMTICASNSSDGPPIALYGLKGDLGSGSTLVTTSTLCHPSGTGSTSCALLNTANSPKTTLNVVGMTYATRSTIDINLNNSSSKLFYWGVISYAIEFGATGSPNLGANLVDVKDGWPSAYVPPQNRFYLNVFTCPSSGTPCPNSGTPSLRAVIQTGDDLSGNALPANNILVLGWGADR